MRNNSPRTTKREPLLGHLAREIPGGVVLPGDADFDEAVSTFIAVGRPDLVVRPRTAEEVAVAVRYARDRAIPLTVRAGGHSIAGLSTATGGMLLDLRRMRTIEVDPADGLVRIDGGASWGRVAKALQPHGLGLTAGDTASVGVGGLTLGGGIGWMVRRHGLAIDSLVGAELVTADGAILQLSAQRHPDLFWALRGGGGGLGVVTRFDFVPQQVEDVVFGRVTYPADAPRGLLTAWRDAQRGADERLTTTLSLAPAMGDRPAMALIGLCFAGQEADSMEVLRPFLALGQGRPRSCEVAVRPYAEILEDEERSPGGMQVTMRNAFVPDLSDAALADVAAVYAAGSTMVSLRALGGAVARVPAEATAFAHRSAEALVVAAHFGPGDISGWPAVAAHGTGSYVNFLTSPAEIETSYPAATARRLARIRAAHHHRTPRLATTTATGRAI